MVRATSARAELARARYAKWYADPKNRTRHARIMTAWRRKRGMKVSTRKARSPVPFESFCAAQVARLDTLLSASVERVTLFKHESDYDQRQDYEIEVRQ
jgi:hypothetical protein